MQNFVLGSVAAEPLSRHPDLVSASTAALVQRLGLGDRIGVFEIDPTLSDTAATQARYDLDPATLGNCVLVAGRRAGQERVAACLVPATTRADVNGVLRRRLDVRKASFLPQTEAVERTGMAYGAITPIGLPDGWPILVDAEVARTPLVLIGRASAHQSCSCPASWWPGCPDPRSLMVSAKSAEGPAGSQPPTALVRRQRIPFQRFNRSEFGFSTRSASPAPNTLVMRWPVS